MRSVPRGLAGWVILFALSPVLAQEPPPRPDNWPEVKCQRYRAAYGEAIARLGTRGMRPEFLEKHSAFMAGGCTAKADICPVSKEELELANRLVMLGMNRGMSGTFFPFACRSEKRPDESSGQTTN